MKYDAEFRKWLISTKGISLKGAGDLVSRCRRVERDLKLSLDSSLHSKDGMEKIQAKIRLNAAKMASEGADQGQLVTSLKGAVRRYWEYLANH